MIRATEEQGPPVSDVSLSRRQVLRVGAGTAGLAIAAASGSGPAQAARVRTVTKYVAVKYSYDPKSQVTRVTKHRVTTVTAKFAGKKVFEKRHGRWVRTPYIWDGRKRALVYSRRLHLKLLAARGGSDDQGSFQPPAETTPTSPPPQPPPTDPPTQPPQPPADDPTVTSVSPYANADPAHHVLNRVGFGVSPQGLQDVQAAGGAMAWLRQQLHPDDVDDGLCQRYLGGLPNQADDIWQVADDLRAGRREGWRELNWVNTGMIVRAAWSRRQLLASLEELWGNHFNVTVPSDGIAASRAHYQWTIRTHALGRFEDLLFAASTHPAMLTYLNNRESDDEHPNENQGRELLELHTVGLEAGYTEDDVVNSARILTGLSVDGESEEFEYKPWRHWVGPVAVLGFSHSNPTRDGGLEVFREYAHYLATHPSTARRISAKLARWFVTDAPSQAYLDGLVSVYRTTQGSIASMLEHIFASTEFWSSAGGRTRRPFDAFVAAIRRLGVAPQDSGLDSLTWIVDDIGQAPFGAPYPTGWPDAPQAWASPLVTLNRWNRTMALCAGWLDAVTEPDLRGDIFGDDLPSTHGEAIDSIGRHLFGMPPGPAHKQALLGFLGKTAASPATPNSAVFGWRLPYLVALMCDSPYLLSK